MRAQLKTSVPCRMTRLRYRAPMRRRAQLYDSARCCPSLSAPDSTPSATVGGGGSAPGRSAARAGHAATQPHVVLSLYKLALLLLRIQHIRRPCHRMSATLGVNRLLADPGTPGVLRVCCRLPVSAEYLVTAVAFEPWGVCTAQVAGVRRAHPRRLRPLGTPTTSSTRAPG